MFQLAIPASARRIILTAGLLMAALSTGAAGVGWYLTRCDMHTYLDRAKASWLDAREKYHFACGSIWHSTDGGQRWARVRATGLPFGLREGQIGVDRKPGLLYLGVLTFPGFSLDCPKCAWTRVRPVIYISLDSGQHWQPAYGFKDGPLGSTRFLAVHADPDYESAAWIILQRGDEATYYGTNTAGKLWQQTCVEADRNNPHCDPPDELLRFRYDKAHPSHQETP